MQADRGRYRLILEKNDTYKVSSKVNRNPKNLKPCLKVILWPAVTSPAWTW